MNINTIINGESLSVLKTLPSESVDLVVTSPPYFSQRDYGVEEQIGQEKTPQEYISKMVIIFNECKRILKKTGSIWLNISETYINKSLIGIPERIIIAMVDNGLIRRNTIIWHKPNCMPSSRTDKFTVDFEYFYFFVKSLNFYFETQYEPHLSDYQKYESARKKWTGKWNGKSNHKYDGIYNKRSIPFSNPQNPLGRIKRSVWQIPIKSNIDTHFAPFPEQLVETPIRACCPINICNECDKIEACYCNSGSHPGIVLDPFCGSGTTCLVAKKLGRNYLGIDLNSDYVKMATTRLLSVL